MKPVAPQLFRYAAIGSALLTAAIFILLYALALPLFAHGDLLTLLTTPWNPEAGHYGIYPMVITSLSCAFFSVIISTPLSLGCALFITLYGPRRLRRPLLQLVRLMSSIPTVVYAFAALFLLVPLVREILGGSGLSLLSAIVILALLIAPTLTLLFVDSFQRVPRSHQHAVVALGGNRSQRLWYVLLPAAWPGLLNALLLGLGRAMGDTLISLMLAGNAVQVPQGLAESGRTLTAHIALVIAADFASLEFRSLFACAVVLYLFSTLLVVTVRLTGKWSGQCLKGDHL